MTLIGGGAALFFAGFAVAGKAKEHERDEVKMMRDRYLAADINLGIAGASLTAALIWFLATPSGDASEPAPAASLSLVPASGADLGLGLRARF